METLYPWQQDCLRLWFENGCRGIAGVATGAGKTRLALEAAARLRAALPDRELRIRIVVPRIFLAHQWKTEIASYFEIPVREIGLWYGGRKDSPERPFMVYVLDSARYSLSRHILSDAGANIPVLLICDEAHHYGSEENAHVFDYVPYAPKESVLTLGLSATPEAERFTDVIAPALGSVFFRYGIEEATRDRITAPYQLFHVAVPFSPEERGEYDTLSDRIARAEAMFYRTFPRFFAENTADFIRKLNQIIRGGGKGADAAERLKRLYFQRKRILLLAESRVQCGVELARLLAEECKTILFTERIATANALFERLSGILPGRTGLYHSALLPEQKEFTLSCYREGRVRLLICCRALDEGLNVPDTGAAIVVSSSTTELQRIQRIGRVLRKTPNKELKRIYYLYIPDTSESPEYLPGTKAGAERLSFNANELKLRASGYDEYADSVIERLQTDNASEEQLASASCQIERGRINTDWRLPPEELETRLKAQKEAIGACVQDRNYWAMMLLISRAREKAARAEPSAK